MCPGTGRLDTRIVDPIANMSLIYFSLQRKAASSPTWTRALHWKHDGLDKIRLIRTMTKP